MVAKTEYYMTFGFGHPFPNLPLEELNDLVAANDCLRRPQIYYTDGT